MKAHHRLPASVLRLVRPYYEAALGLVPSSSHLHRFIIYGQGRTGSTLLQRMLHQHPNVSCIGEPLNQLWKRPLLTPDRVIENRALAEYRKGYSTFGCHIKSYQLLNGYGTDPSRFIERQIAGRWQVIHLYRSDTVRQCISTLVAEQRGVYHHATGSERSERQPVCINTDKLLELCRLRADLKVKEHEQATRLGLLQINYETHLLDPGGHQRTADLCFAYLGLASIVVKTPLERTGASRVSDQVANYSAVRSALREAGFDPPIT